MAEYQQVGYQPVEGESVPAEMRNLGVLCHVLGLVWLLVGPLIFWQFMKDRHSFVNDCGKEAVNYGISMMIYYSIAGLLCIIIIGLPILFILTITHIVLVIKAALAVSEGQMYRYPITMRLIS
ncbi:MAG: DUF4870 domain-containing protein [Planctomycetes bacterium]|nr:DUF4870 domain-containing protein [Planctomycetota bacterium]